MTGREERWDLNDAVFDVLPEAKPQPASPQIPVPPSMSASKRSARRCWQDRQQRRHTEDPYTTIYGCSTKNFGRCSPAFVAVSLSAEGRPATL